MNVQDLALNVAKFLGHHSGELRMIGSALETVVTHLPIDQQDKERLISVADQLQTAAGNIAKGAAALSGEEIEVVIDKADVVDAVREVVAEETHNDHA